MIIRLFSTVNITTKSALKSNQVTLCQINYVRMWLDAGNEMRRLNWTVFIKEEVNITSIGGNDAFD